MANDDYEEVIKKLLFAQRKPLTTRKIASKTDITWPTAKKHLSTLASIGKVEGFSRGNKIYWQVVIKEGGNSKFVLRVDNSLQKEPYSPSLFFDNNFLPEEV